MKVFPGLILVLCALDAPCASAQARKFVVPELFRDDEAPVRVYRHWTTFLHPRYGYLLPVPPEVRSIGVPEAASQTSFVSQDGSFTISAWGGLTSESPTALFEAEWRRVHARYGRLITYQRKAWTWFVVSGTDREGTEFYEKFLLRGDHVGSFAITFPQSRMREFEPWVEQIEDGFRLVALPQGAPELAHRSRSAAVERPEYAETAPQESPRATYSRSTEEPRPSPRAKSEFTTPNPAQRQRAAAPSSASTSAQQLPVGAKAVGKPGFVYSPFDSGKLVDVVGVPSGTKVKCPDTMKIFLVP